MLPSVADLGAIVSLLLLAREHAVEPAVAAGNVDYKEDAPVRNPDRAGLTAAQFKAKCRSWGHPRKPRLPLKPAAAEFEVQVRVAKKACLPGMPVALVIWLVYGRPATLGRAAVTACPHR